jgi:C-terminal processing protease CtpA/Prc
LRFKLPLALFALLLLFVAGTQQFAHAQIGKFDRDSTEAMLDAARDDLKKNYFDPTLHGIDIETRFKDAKERVKQATTRDQLIITVAQTMLDFNDSHTFFIPPSRAAKIEYGWEMQMVGDKAFVTAVKPKSDAEAKGLKQGDEVVSVDGYAPSRDNMWKMLYRYYLLIPARAIRLQVKSPGQAEPREIEVLTKIERSANVTDWGNIFISYLRERKDVGEDRAVEFGNELLVWRMTTFSTDEDHIKGMMGRASKFKALIIDLRGNGGGAIDALAKLGGYFFDHDVKIADMKGRKETKPITAKTRGGGIYKGQVIVLIDSESASASELFARTMQIEKRATILGDRSAGAVMASRYYEHQTGVGQVLYFGNSITVADLIMTDGKSLEKTGVVPDEGLTPTGEDLAAKRDPVLARAAEILGVKVDPEKAGTFFPKEWRN